MKNRDAAQRFAGTDDPISTDDITTINNGKTAAGDEGKIGRFRSRSAAKTRSS